MALTSHELLGTLLREVSRSFYLTLRVLPRGIRPQIGLAYLLARATDTIADTRLVDVRKRLEALDALRGRILGSHTLPVDFGHLAQQQGTPGERTLLSNIEPALALLAGLAEADRALVRQVLATITSGQELDLRRFGQTPAGDLRSLQTAEDLDDYTYRVAGCVGEFWTKICRLHVFGEDALDDTQLLADGIRFGKGLQLVNILRDLPRDLRDGRCYIPESVLADTGLKPRDLLDSANEPLFRDLYSRHLNLAEAHLTAGWRYTNTIPRREMRLRLACAWPVMIGFDTLRLLRTANILNPAERVKVGRSRVRQMMMQSLVLYPFRKRWASLCGGSSPS